MSYETERVNIETAFRASWGSTTTIQTENKDFTPPASGAWVVLTILRGQSEVVGLSGGNSRRYRHPGVLQIDVVIEQAKGTKVVLDLCDTVAAIFRGKRISGIVFLAPEGPTRIDEPETSRLRFAVSIPFYRDTTLVI